MEPNDSPTVPASTPEPDYDHILRSNLERVFNERDPLERAAAIAELFVEEPVMFEPDKVVVGRGAISDVAGALLEQFGLTFRFVPDRRAVGHHGLGVLRWHGGPDGQSTVTGADAAEIVGGRIARLWVMLDGQTS